MKFFAPILFAGVALASTKFTVRVNSDDVPFFGHDNATIPQPYDELSRVGFTYDRNTGDVVLSLDDQGHLEGFVLRKEGNEDGIFGLVVDQPIEGTGDITGSFTIDDNTGEFRNTFDSDLRWWFCSPQGTPDEQVYIYLTAGPVAVDSCWTVHELIAWPL
ncbi:uncharacterized protein C8A04DRAFT_30915 [Dichotomopilus funicola]|uniref:Uncharacterized protein n=1 Tax=Dichotomopilus funicola TaxID=1934379 RepID=A0AAN6ZJH3_9PEZI|nr:hypothetical protein C8A04DRAFT_30915 [Dichotomopilus funicola]